MEDVGDDNFFADKDLVPKRFIPLDINMEALNKYIEFQINFKTSYHDRESSRFIVKFRKCRIDDFESRNITPKQL